MNNQKTLAEIKALARTRLSGNYSKCIGITIIYCLLALFINVISTADTSRSVAAAVISIIISIIISTLLILLKTGLYNYYIKLSCKKDFNTNDIFNAFLVNGKRNWLFAFLVVMIENICLLPATYMLIISANVIYTIIAFIVGLILDFIISIFLSQIYFLIFDFPDKNIKELLELSFYLMKDQLLRFALLSLSFFLLEVVGLLTCGIGLLWVMPYKYTSYACYYLDLVKTKTGK